ncbi:MAG: CBS domain-containing protein [Clostridia bacterium]|nr:CBS domain-containing protein [Clostridia bacterium]
MNILRFMIPKSLSVYIRDDSTVRQGTEKMRYHRYVAIPILDSEGKYVDTLRNDDVLNYFIENKNLTRRDLEKTPVMAVADTSCKPLSHDASFESLFEEVREHNFVPVVDDRGCFIGIVLRREVMNYLWKKRGV